MKINVTSRRFKAPPALIEYVEKELQKLDHFYDGIIKADVVLGYEKSTNSTKTVEVKVAVYGTVLMAIVRNNDFKKATATAVQKVLAQLKKYKEKLHLRDRKLVRTVKAKS
jgi:putative sigma-54 modulation protein